MEKRTYFVIGSIVLVALAVFVLTRDVSVGKNGTGKVGFLAGTPFAFIGDWGRGIGSVFGFGVPREAVSGTLARVGGGVESAKQSLKSAGQSVRTSIKDESSNITEPFVQGMRSIGSAVSSARSFPETAVTKAGEKAAESVGFLRSGIDALSQTVYGGLQGVADISRNNLGANIPQQLPGGADATVNKVCPDGTVIRRSETRCEYLVCPGEKPK